MGFLWLPDPRDTGAGGSGAGQPRSPGRQERGKGVIGLFILKLGGNEGEKSPLRVFLAPAEHFGARREAFGLALTSVG